jgi:hypothetical protein
MWRLVLGLLLAGGAWGCGEKGPISRSVLDQQMFGPTAIRIHPTFTQVRALSGGTKPDGIEATLEVQDQFGEPTRATGQVIFELYSYRKDTPDVKGRRLSQPWIALLNTRDEQQEHWNSALRAYTFQLHFPQISNNEYYVLTAQFDLNGGAAAAGMPRTMPTTMPSSAPGTQSAGRLFDQLIIEPQGEEKVHGKYRAPTRTPGH